MEKIVKFFRDEDGLELTEYAVMGFLIVATVVATIILLQGRIIAAFQTLVAALT
jgi:pilus assembly protein Flp/PilA